MFWEFQIVITYFLILSKRRDSIQSTIVFIAAIKPDLYYKHKIIIYSIGIAIDVFEF